MVQAHQNHLPTWYLIKINIRNSISLLLFLLVVTRRNTSCMC